MLMMNMHDPTWVDAQRTRLVSEQQNLEAELARIARKDPVGDDYHARVEEIGRAEDENVHEEEQYEAARSVEQNLELQLRDVRLALQRITDGTYGICSVCGSPIDQKRLEALPSAATCVAHVAQAK